MSKVLLYPEASSVLWVLVAVSELFVRAALRGLLSTCRSGRNTM